MTIHKKDIITDEEIDRVHANANFGAMTKRAVVDEGVLHLVFGYHVGSTMRAILVEHGLTLKAGPYDNLRLNAKGMKYFKATYAQFFNQIRDLAQ